MAWLVSVAGIRVLKFGKGTMASESAERGRALWRAADAVCFDVDSTAVLDEVRAR
jgi:hypothetical protein